VVGNPLTVRASALQALREGPAYGSELVARFAGRAVGRARLTPARVYPVLTALARAGLLKTLHVTPRGRRGGRTRVYYALTAAGKYARAGARLLDILGRDRCAIVGGMAVNAHGFVRATRDVDVVTAMSLEDARRLLRHQGVEVRLLKGDRLEGGFDCLKGVIG